MVGRGWLFVSGKRRQRAPATIVKIANAMLGKAGSTLLPFTCEFVLLFYEYPSHLFHFVILLKFINSTFVITASARMGARMPPMQPKEEQKVSAMARTYVGKSSAVKEYVAAYTPVTKNLPISDRVTRNAAGSVFKHNYISGNFL